MSSETNDSHARRPQERSVERLTEINRELIRTAADLSAVATAAQSLYEAPLMEQAHNQLERLASSAFVLAIVGEFKRGKSTLANAMLGADVMPSDVLPTTASINRVVYGRTPSVTLHFLDGRTQTIPVAELPRFVTKLDEESEARAASLAEAVVHFPTHFCRHNVELLDTPGLGDEAHLTERTMSAIAAADAAVVVTSSLAPFSLTEARIVETLLEQVDPSRLFFVLGHTDQVRPADVPRILTMVRRRIGKTIGQPPESLRVFPVSALEACRAKAERDEARLTASGFDVFEQALEAFLVRDRGIAAVQVANEALARSATLLGQRAASYLARIQAEEQQAAQTLADRIAALKALAQTAELHSNSLLERATSTLEQGQVLLAGLYTELVDDVQRTISGLNFQESEVTDSARRHALVESRVAPRVKRIATKRVNQIQELLRVWISSELDSLSSLRSRLDELLEANMEPSGPASETDVELSTNRPSVQTREYVVTDNWVDESTTELIQSAASLTLTFVPESIAGSVRSLAADVARNDVVRGAWLRLQGDRANQKLRERTEMMARLQKQDYVEHLGPAIDIELKRLRLERHFAKAYESLLEKLTLKTRGETELVEKVCEIQPWELRVARQREHGERQRDIERTQAAASCAQQTTRHANDRIAMLGTILTEAPTGARESNP